MISFELLFIIIITDISTSLDTVATFDFVKDKIIIGISYTYRMPL